MQLIYVPVIQGAGYGSRNRRHDGSSALQTVQVSPERMSRKSSVRSACGDDRPWKNRLECSGQYCSFLKIESGCRNCARSMPPRGAASRRVKFLPMASAAPPVSTAAEQQHQNNDNKDQFHKRSPLGKLSKEGTAYGELSSASSAREIAALRTNVRRISNRRKDVAPSCRWAMVPRPAKAESPRQRRAGLVPG